MPKTVKTTAVKKKKITPVTKSKEHRKKLPSYIAFTKQVLSELSTHRSTFGRLVIVLFVAVFFASGLTQHGVYSGLTQSTSEVSGQLADGAFKTLIEIWALFMSVIGGTLTTGLSESQQLYMGIIYLFAWLTTVWLLRHLLAGNKVSMRDGLYSAGAPLISTLVIGVVMMLQTLPFAIGAAIFSTLSSSGVLSGWLYLPAILVIFGLVALTIYWLASSVFAAIVVTIPGTYPRAALQSAKGLINGRRAELIKRIVWLLVLVLMLFVVAVVPMIAFDAVLGYPFSWLVVSWVILVGVCAFMYSSAYMYMLYRGILDERA